MISRSTSSRILKLLLVGVTAATLLSAAPRSSLAANAEAPVNPRSQEISFYFNRSQTEISGLRAQGFGFAEIVKILVIAEMAREPIPKLLARNSEGSGWGTISKELGLNTVYVKIRVDQARASLHVLAAAPKPKSEAKKTK